MADWYMYVAYLKSIYRLVYVVCFLLGNALKSYAYLLLCKAHESEGDFFLSKHVVSDYHDLHWAPASAQIAEFGQASILEAGQRMIQ